MTSITPNITASASLSISVSGTANLQKALATAKPGAAIPLAGATAPTPTAAGGSTSAAEALSSASDETRNAILQALQLYDPKASLVGYKDGDSFANAQGSRINLIA